MKNFNSLEYLNNKSVFISTIFSERGGVSEMLRVLLMALGDSPKKITVGYYRPRTLSPQLSVCSWELLRKKISQETSIKDGVKYIAMGAYLPELENLNYFPTKLWRAEINNVDICFCVGGSLIQALPFYLLRKKCIAWFATPYFEDKKDRVLNSYGVFRKFFDTFLISPLGKFLEKKIASSQNVYMLPLSEYTKKKLMEVKTITSLPVPVPIRISDFFQVKKFTNTSVFLGFTGRLSDPRKNIKILLQAMVRLKTYAKDIQLILCGDCLLEVDLKYIEDNNLSESIVLHRFVSREKLIKIYESIDIFVIPSFQEGLAIVGLEAMATGSPIITTKCGGPEEYVRDGENGFVIDFDCMELAARVIDIVESKKRESICNRSRKIVEEEYSFESFFKKINQSLSFLED